MPIALNNSTLVTVFGGSGFLGRYVVQALARNGCRVRVAVRHPNLAGYLQPLGSVGQIHPVQANLRYEDSVRRAMEGADAVVNLVGILQQSGKQRFQALQTEGAATVARVAADIGAGAMVHVSSIGASTTSRSAYARSKAEGEELVRKAFHSAVILRPSILFGPEDDFFNRFASMARFAPFMPLIAGGRTKFQPVYAGDVAKAVLAGLTGKAKPGFVYELGGPRVYSFRELLDLIAEYSQRKRPYFPIPFWLAKFQALFLQLLPNAPLTVDQVRQLQVDNIVSQGAIAEARTLEALDIEPCALETIVPRYLIRFRPKGEFSTHHA